MYFTVQGVPMTSGGKFRVSPKHFNSFFTSMPGKKTPCRIRYRVVVESYQWQDVYGTPCISSISVFSISMVEKYYYLKLARSKWLLRLLPDKLFATLAFWAEDRQIWKAFLGNLRKCIPATPERPSPANPWHVPALSTPTRPRSKAQWPSSSHTHNNRPSTAWVVR